MTVAVSAKELVNQLSNKFPGAIEEAGAESILVKSENLPEVVGYLKTADGLKFDYLNFITAADYYSYFEVVYMFTSMEFNRSITLKARSYTRDNPTIPSLTGLYQGHPNLKRIFLWEGFDGHPLRKDFNR
jgi:NADH-quinone oxidoreductase subunit C